MIKYIVTGVVALIITRGTVNYFTHRCTCMMCKMSRGEWEDWGCADCVPGMVFTEVGCEPYIKCGICGWDYRLPVTWDFSPQVESHGHLGRWYCSQ